MVELYWPNKTTVLGPSERYPGPGTFEIPDEWEERARARGFQDPPGAGTEITAADAPISPGDYTVDELETELADTDYTDDELTAIRKKEKQNKRRQGALDAIDAELEA